MPSVSPTVVLVHGAWADGSSRTKVISLLLSRGMSALARYTEDGRLKMDNNGGGASAAAHRSGPEELSVCGQRSGGAPDRHPLFTRADLQAPANQFVRVPARCHRSCVHASGAAGLGACATRVEALPPGFCGTSRGLNGSVFARKPCGARVSADIP